MTKQEALIAEVQVSGIPDNSIAKALIDYAIDGSATYTAADSDLITKAAIEILEGMLALASVTEGGYSVTYSIPGIEARLKYLKDKTGITTGLPTIKGVRPW
jgi:hypothetical protein